MTPAEMAKLHAACFTTPRPWSEAEFASLLSSDTTILAGNSLCFALVRHIADEAELLSIATDPIARRQGHAARVLGDVISQLSTLNVVSMFLEVAAENQAAIALYTSKGFAKSGERRGYYRTPTGEKRDAWLFTKRLN